MTIYGQDPMPSGPSQVVSKFADPAGRKTPAQVAAMFTTGRGVAGDRWVDPISAALRPAATPQPDPRGFFRTFRGGWRYANGNGGVANVNPPVVQRNGGQYQVDGGRDVIANPLREGYASTHQRRAQEAKSAAWIANDQRRAYKNNPTLRDAANAHYAAGNSLTRVQPDGRRIY